MLINVPDFVTLPIKDKIQALYQEGEFITSIRYYKHKINLYMLGGLYFEVFINDKDALIEKVVPLDWHHSRLKFYLDQVKVRRNIW